MLLRPLPLTRHVWAAIDNNLFFSFWKFYALSFLFKTRYRRIIEALKLEKLTLSQLLSSFLLVWKANVFFDV